MILSCNKITNSELRHVAGTGLITLLLSLIALLLVSSCGESEEPPPPSDDGGLTIQRQSGPQGKPPTPDNLLPHPPDPALLADWESFTYRTVKIMYPDGHPMESTLYTMANVILFGQRQLAQFLSFPGALDTVTIFYYTGPGQSLEMVGTYHPFVTDDGIQFTPPSPYGAPLAMYVLRKWQEHPTRFPFLREGLVALFDLSGQDYYEQTRKMFDDTTRQLSLVELAADTTVNANREREKSGPAATFVNFVRYSGGPAAYRDLYHYQGDFAAAVNDVLGIDLATAERQWREFVNNPPAADDTTSSAD